MSFQKAITCPARVERAVNVEERVALVHGSPVAGQGRHCAIFEQVGYVE